MTNPNDANLTKRETFAKGLLESLVMAGGDCGPDEDSIKDMADTAVVLADVLINRLNK